MNEMNDIMQYTKISIVTTCKGRLFYLKESLPTWLKLDYGNYEILIVDYDCPDATCEFIEANKELLLKESKALDVRVVKVENKPFFNLNDARNIGISHTDSPLIFMIDSDVHIDDRHILKEIDSMYKKGVIFFSNLPVLNTNYFEAQAFYKILYRQIVDVPAVLPLISESVGSTGTVCFKRDLYERCGKYDAHINEVGYGCDDIEFYLRYLNSYFYEDFLPGKGKNGTPIHKSLDSVLERFMTFQHSALADIQNPDEEKDRFYPVKKELSAIKTFSFINRFFDNFPWRGYGQTDAEPYPMNFKETFLKRKNLPVPPSFFSWFLFWYGQKLYEQNHFEASKEYLQRLVKEKDVNSTYLANAYFFLGDIEKNLGKTDVKGYYSKSLEYLLPKKNKTDKELYLIASLYKRLENFKKARDWFHRILALKRGENIYPGIYFHLGELHFQERKYEMARMHFSHCLYLDPNHRKARSYIEKIKELSPSPGSKK